MGNIFFEFMNVEELRYIFFTTVFVCIKAENQLD